jgi:uncharacterized SAM-binding protein YcdF (DUF218 family)
LRDERKWKRAGRTARLVMSLLMAWWLVAWGAARALVVRGELERADALAVLGGSGVYVERTRHAARLFREGRASKVILTNDGQRGGWSNALRRNPFFVERAAEELRRAGLSPEKIEVLPRVVASTYEEAVMLREYAASHGLRSLLVVTSGYHARRALWAFERVFRGSGIAVGLDPVAPGEQKASTAVWWLRPGGWQMVAGEYLKLVYYRWRYR